MYIQQPQTHKLRNTWGIISIIIIIVCLVTIFIGKRLNNPYQKINNTQNLSLNEVITKREQDSLSNKLEIDFYYLKGCRHCNKVSSAVVPGIQANRTKSNLIIMNAAPKSMHAYLRHNRVYGYPTMAVRYHGNLIYQYTGMSKTKFKEILNGIDPATHTEFSKKNPNITYRQNGYTQRLTKEPVLGFTK